MKFKLRTVITIFELQFRREHNVQLLSNSCVHAPATFVNIVHKFDEQLFPQIILTFSLKRLRVSVVGNETI